MSEWLGVLCLATVPVTFRLLNEGGLPPTIEFCAYLSRALAFGKTESQVREELGSQSSNEALVKSKIFEGNKPTNSIMFQKLNPATLGSLIAMYEHKIHVQGAVWGINSYDQMGVELGKVLAKAILGQLGSAGDVKGHDSSVSDSNTDPL